MLIKFIFKKENKYFEGKLIQHRNLILILYRKSFNNLVFNILLIIKTYD